MKTDKYDEAIAHLTKHPSEIQDAWNDPFTHPGGCLFMYAERGEHSTGCAGCLTQVKRGILYAQTDELTDAIRADERIPEYACHITVEMLPVFAEWQRRIDNELGE